VLVLRFASRCRDDLEILGTLDRLEDAGRAYSMNGEDLLQAVADGRSVGDDRNGFARILLMLRDETPQRVRFDQQQWQGIQPPHPQQHEYLQSLWHFQLTTGGRDRACGRVVLEGLPDPSHDDGRTIPALVLREFAEIIATYYTASKMALRRHTATLMRATSGSSQAEFRAVATLSGCGAP
jgi:hypothetical protein